MSSYLLPLLVLLPLLGALVVLVMPTLMPATNRPQTLWTSAIVTASLTLLLTIVVAAVPLGGDGFQWSDEGAGMQLGAQTEWIPAFGLELSFGADAFSLLLVILTTAMMPVILLATRDHVIHRAREFYFWMLVLLASLIGAFLATDLIFFYICFEFTLVPLFFIISLHGGTQRLRAATIYFFYTFAGSILTLGALIYLAWWNASQTDAWTFSIAQLTASAATLPLSAQGWVLLALLAGFAVKLAMFPFHSWKPVAYTEAPAAGSAVLAALLLQLGVYGMFRIALPMTPDAVLEWAPLLATLGIIGVLYAALIAWTQRALKPLIAFASISHAGFVIVGFMALNVEGIGGALTYAFNQGLITAALFLCVGMLQHRYQSQEIGHYGGLARVMPVWSCFFVFFCLASVGVPGLNGFVGEFLALQGAFIAQNVLGPVYAIAAALGIILAAIYILYMVGRVVFGPVKVPTTVRSVDGESLRVRDLTGTELGALIPLAVACVVLGLFPNLFLTPISSPVNLVVERFEHRLIVQEAGENRAIAAGLSAADFVSEDRPMLLGLQRQELPQ